MPSPTISNAALTEEDVPASSHDERLWEFAHSFFAYQLGSEGQDAPFQNHRMALSFTEVCRKRFRARGMLPHTLTQLRSCLFCEARLYSTVENYPFYNSLWIDALLTAIRTKVIAGEVD
jgi:hypothetical protein